MLCKMLVLLRSNRRRQLIRELDLSHSLNRFHFQYYFSSTSSVRTVSQNDSSNFMVDYLVNTIGLSRDEALLASTKVSHLKSTQKPDFFINLIKKYGGLDQSHIRELVSSVPQVLVHKSNETLESKFRAFQDLGLTGSNLVKLIKASPSVLLRGLDTRIVPIISYLRQLMGGCDDKVVRAINKSSWLLSCHTLKSLPPNIDLLQQHYGFSSEQIQKLVIFNPRVMLQTPERLKVILSRVEADLGIPHDSLMFIYGVILLSSISRPIMEKKFSVFRSFGWSDSDIAVLVRAHPLTLKASESAIRQKLNFYMKEVGLTPAYLAAHHFLFGISLEKRVKPRNEVLKTLKELKLVRSRQPLYSVLVLKEAKFVERFLLPYKDEVPNLYETYTQHNQRLKA